MLRGDRSSLSPAADNLATEGEADAGPSGARSVVHPDGGEGAAHAHFAGAVGQYDQQPPVILGRASAGIDFVLRAQAEIAEAKARRSLRPTQRVRSGGRAPRG